MSGVEIRKSRERGSFANYWLNSRFSFSFADYYDPEHIAFGPLRVINEDQVRPGTGFDPHPHRDMEIITVVLEGAVAHEDSTGGRGVVRAGEVQVMSAGTGVVHSEKNPSSEEPLHLMQIWIMPDRRGHEPRYEQAAYPVFGNLPEGASCASKDPVAAGGLVPVASGRGVPGALRINQDATLYLARLEPGETIEPVIEAGRRGYLHLVDGRLTAAGVAMEGGDAIKLTPEDGGTALRNLTARADERARLMYFDLP